MTKHMRLPRNALAHLRKDRALARVIAAVGPFRLELGAGETHLGALVRAIVYQQLSGKAAATIHGRFRALFPPERHPTAAEILRISEDQIRACGLSRQKAASLRDLCEKVSSGDVPLDGLSTESDEAIVAQLIHVRGIGVWSAQMFLLFHLGRPDVWPIDDLGVRKGIELVRGLPATPSPKATAELGERYRPFRSVAAWYCWRALDLPSKPATRVSKRPAKSRTSEPR